MRLILDVVKNATLVPNNAVQIGQNGPMLFVVKKDSTLDLRQVKPGQKQANDFTRDQQRSATGGDGRDPRSVATRTRNQSGGAGDGEAPRLTNPKETTRRLGAPFSHGRTDGDDKAARTGNGTPMDETNCLQAHPRKAKTLPAKKLVQFSSGLSRPFIQRPVMTMLLTASIIVFGILTYNQLAVNDLPAVDYPVIQVQRLVSRARIRKRWRTPSPRRWKNSSPKFPAST